MKANLNLLYEFILKTTPVYLFFLHSISWSLGYFYNISSELNIRAFILWLPVLAFPDSQDRGGTLTAGIVCSSFC